MLTKIRVQNSTPGYFFTKNGLQGSMVVSLGHLPFSLHAHGLLGAVVWAAPHGHGRKWHGSNKSSLILVLPSFGRDSFPSTGRDSTASDSESHLDEAEFKMSCDAFDPCLPTMDLHVVTGSQTRRKLENFSWTQLKWAEMPRCATNAG